MVMLGTRYFRAVQTTADHDLNALGAGVHCLAHCLLHRAAEERALFKLSGDVFRKKLGVEIGVLDLDDVNVNLFAVDKLFEVLFELVDTDVLLTYDLAGELCVNGYRNLALRRSITTLLIPQDLYLFSINSRILWSSMRYAAKSCLLAYHWEFHFSMMPTRKPWGLTF